MRMTPKIGTTEYMAPEAFAGRIKPMLADRTDVWSMGVLLHVIFIGHFPSPRLAEIELKEYLALPCWARVSSRGRDFLGTLLHHDPAQRPNVTTAMKHPWLSLAARPDIVRSAAHIPHAIKSFASSPELRRLALAVAARELDDRELVSVRRLFHEIERECSGALTRVALERLGHQTGLIGSVAAELAHCFEEVDLDGSGTIDWTELVGAALSSEAALAAPPRNHQERSVLDDACWSSFDLLSQGTGSVTGSSLAHLLLPAGMASDGSPAGIPTLAGGPSGGTGGSFDEAALDGAFGHQRVFELYRIVREFDTSGAVASAQFHGMMRGSMSA